MISLIFSIALAAETKGVGFIQEAVKKYNAAAGVSMNVKKTVTLAILDETNTSEGKLYFSKGNLRLELSKPDDSLVVLNKEAIWVESSSEGFDGPSRHVMKITSKDLKKRTKAPLAMLLTSSGAWKDFKVVKESADAGVVKLELRPKVKDSFPEMTAVDVTIDSGKKEIQRLSYQDEIENVVTYEFSKTDVKSKISKTKFSYKPPKNAEVVVY